MQNLPTYDTLKRNAKFDFELGSFSESPPLNFKSIANNNTLFHVVSVKAVAIYKLLFDCFPLTYSNIVLDN